jgi:hypothetical protein
MPPITTPNGMQSAIDASELTFQAGHPQGWEHQAGGMFVATAGYVDYSKDPVGFSTWKKARSDANLTKSPH